MCRITAASRMQRTLHSATACGVQEVGVAVDLLRVRRIDLQVAEQVADHIAEEDDAGDGHDGFLADVDS